MVELGAEHAKKGIPAKYLDLMGPTFCNAIRSSSSLHAVVCCTVVIELFYNYVLLKNLVPTNMWIRCLLV